MNDNESTILRKIAETAKEVSPVDADILLYGSRARGDSRKDSDWDLLILLDKEKITLDDLDDIAYPIREMGWTLNADVNPILYTKNEWKESSFTPFYKNVTQDAIRL